MKRPSAMMLAGAVLLAGSSCSVLEDRVPCPCYLDIDYREVLSADFAEEPDQKIEVGLVDTSYRWTVDHPLEICPEQEEVSVGKARLRAVAIVHGHPFRSFLEDDLKICYEPGNQIDELYVHSEEVDCTDEEARCVLHPHKQFSTLTFTDEEGGDLCRRYNMVIRGTTCGFDVMDFSALDGVYLYTVQEDDGQGEVRVRIPRQKQDDLLLEFWDKDDHLRRFTCPIGLYLFAAGYDPEARDLQDYVLRIDFRAGLLYLRVADWEDEYLYSLYD